MILEIVARFSISSVEETRPEQHLRWLREANSDPYAGISIELDALDRDVPQPHVTQLASPRSQVAAEHEEQQNIQRAYIELTGVTSEAAVFILACTTQEVLDASCTLASSSQIQVPLQQPGVPVSNESMDPVQKVSPLSSPIQESASPDTPPKVSAQPFVRIGGDFRLPSNPTQSQNSTLSSLSNVLAMKLTNKLKTAYWPSMITGKDKITACLAWDPRPSLQSLNAKPLNTTG